MKNGLKQVIGRIAENREESESLYRKFLFSRVVASLGVTEVLSVKIKKLGCFFTITTDTSSFYYS